MHAVPGPLSVIITNNKVINPIRPIESAVTLTCAVELTPLVDIPVAVNTVWTGPDGFMTTNTAPHVMGSTTTYTSTAMVSSIGREQSGQYTCIAQVTSLHNSQYTTDSATTYGATGVTTGKMYCMLTLPEYSVCAPWFTQVSILCWMGECMLTIVSSPKQI